MPLKRRTTFLFTMPLMSTSVANPGRMVFFAIELTQGHKLRFPNLNVTQAMKRSQKGPHEGSGVNAPTCQGGGGG